MCLTLEFTRLVELSVPSHLLSEKTRPDRLLEKLYVDVTSFDELRATEQHLHLDCSVGAEDLLSRLRV